MDLGAFSTYLLDFDGTLWDGRSSIPGARCLLRKLRQRERTIVVVSNNSQLSGAQVSAIIERDIAGFHVPAVTAVDVTPIVLRERAKHNCIAVCGAPTLVDACIRAGLNVVESGNENCTAVLLGCTPAFCYRDMSWIAAQSADGKDLFATNADAFRPGPNGIRVPETGSLLAAIRMVHAGEWEVVGKPGPRLFEHAMGLAGARTEACVVIGDGVSTDIRGAAGLGVKSIWIRGDGENAPDADLVVSSVSDIHVP